MAVLKNIVNYLDKELDNKSVEDSSNNGLQVETRKDIEKVGFAVDACLEVFEKAKQENCDLIIVHHGISWDDNLRRIINNNYEKIGFLIKNDVGLFASHLPLDKHKKFGNNIQICKLLELKQIKTFGDYHGQSIGFGGILSKEIELNKFIEIVNDKLNTNVRVINFGKKKIRSVAVVSGGGSSALYESVMKRYDCLLTGEAKHSDYHIVKENKTNLIIAGHYATEVFGVKALMPVLEKKFEIKTVFIDAPTGF